MTKPGTPISHDPISVEQGKSIVARILSEEMAELFYEGANKLFNFNDVINALGFSYQDWDAIADLVEFLTGIRQLSPEVTATQFLGEFQSLVAKAAAAISADKFTLKGMSSVEIHPMVFSTPRLLRAYGFGSLEELDRAIESAPSSRKAGLQSFRTYINNLIRDTTCTIKAQDILNIGRIVEGYIKAALKTNPEYLYFTLIGASGSFYGFDGRDPEGSARLEVYKILQKYNKTAANFSNNFNILRALNLNGASYEALIDLIKTYYDEALEVENGAMEDSPFDLSMFNVVSDIYEDLRDLIDGNDLKVLFEFAYRAGAEYTPEFEAQIREAENPADLIVAKFDSLYGRLSANQKAALSRLAAIVDLDLDQVLVELRKLADLPEDKTPMDIIKTAFKPVIDKYSPKFAGSPYSVTSSRGYGYNELPDATVYLEGEKPTAEEIRSRLSFYDNRRGGTVLANRIELVGEPKGNAIKRQEVKATITSGGESYEYNVSFGYYSLPSSLANFQAISTTYTNLGAFPYLDQAIRNRLGSTTFSNPGFVSGYNASTHGVKHENIAFLYSYNDLDWTQGDHSIALSTGSGSSISMNFTYQVYKDSDIKFAIEHISGSKNIGYDTASNTILLNRAPDVNEQVIVSLYGYVESSQNEGTRIATSVHRRVLVTLPSINAGETKSITIEGTTLPIYRFAESDIVSSSASLYINSDYCYDDSEKERNDRVYIIKEGQTAEDLSLHGYVFKYYRHGDFYYDASESIRSQDIRIVDLDLSGEKNTIRELSLVYENHSQKIRYALLDKEGAVLRNYSTRLMSSLAEGLGYESFRYYVTLTDGTEKKDYSFNMSTSIDMRAFTFASEDAQVGDHVYEGTFQGVKLLYSYHIIDFNQVTIAVSEEKTDRAISISGADATIVRVPQLVSAIYQDRVIDHWSPSPTQVDKTPGKHVCQTTAYVYDREVSYSYEYVTAGDIGYEFKQTENVAYVLMGSENASIQMEVSIAYTIDGERKTMLHPTIKSIPIPLSATDTATRGLHENVTICVSEGIFAQATYYVYAASDISTYYSDFRQIETVDATATSVLFSYDIVTAIALDDGGYHATYSSGYTYRYEIPANDRTVGTHTASIVINGETYLVEYVISGAAASNATIRNVNFNNEFDNVVAVGETLSVYSAELIYTEKNYGHSQYVYGNELTVIADTSAATSSFVTGYLIYKGQAFTFEYFVYSDVSQLGFIRDESAPTMANTFVYGEKRAGGNYSWYDYGYNSLTLNGTTYALGEKKSRYHSVQLGEEDVTIGQHKVQDGHYESDYEIIGFKDSRIDLKSAVLTGQKDAYRVGEGANFGLTIRYSIGNEPTSEIYVSTNELMAFVDGFSTKESTLGQKKTAKLTYGDLVFTWDYMVYSDEEIDPSTVTSDFTSSNPYFLEGGSNRQYLIGTINYYATLYNERVLIDSEEISASFQNPDWSVGVHTFSFTYGGETYETYYEVIAQDDERLNWDSAYVYGLYNNSTVLAPEGSSRINDAQLYSVMLETEIGSYTLSGYLCANASVLSGYDTSASTNGQYVQATMSTKNNTIRFQYLVYSQSDIKESFAQHGGYYLAGSTEIECYVEVAYRRFLLDAKGEEITLYESVNSFYFYKYPEIEGETFNTDFTERKELHYYYDNAEHVIDYELVIKCVSVNDCEVVTYLNWDSSGTFYEGVSYEGRKIYSGDVYYLYTPDPTDTSGDSGKPRSYEAAHHYYGFYGKGYTVPIDTSTVGKYEGTITLEGHEFTYSYTIETLPQIQYLCVAVYDLVTGECEWLTESGSSFHGSSGNFAFRVESNWIGAPLAVNTVGSENVFQPGNYDGEWIYWTIEGSSADIHLRNELYEGWEFTFTYSYSTPASTDPYTMMIMPSDWNQGQICSWVAIGNGAYESTNQGIHSSNAVMSLTFRQSGTFTFEYDVDGENGCDYLYIHHVTAEGYEETEEFSGSGSYEIKVNEGDVLEFVYRKDSSVDSGRDSAIVSAFVFTPQEN